MGNLILVATLSNHGLFFINFLSVSMMELLDLDPNHSLINFRDKGPSRVTKQIDEDGWGAGQVRGKQLCPSQIVTYLYERFLLQQVK